MDIAEDLFEDTMVVSTSDVVRAVRISEPEAREWAEELGVAKIGAAFGWTKPDVIALCDGLDELADEDDEEDEDDQGGDDDDE